MEYHFKIYREKTGLWAKCLELDGCLTQANSKNTLIENMEEALNLYLDEPQNSTRLFPLPNKGVKLKNNIVKVPVDPKVAFALLLRIARNEKGLTQSAMAKLLNYNSVFSYQKFESAKSANPTLLKVKELQGILPNLRLDLLFG